MTVKLAFHSHEAEDPSSPVQRVKRKLQEQPILMNKLNNLAGYNVCHTGCNVFCTRPVVTGRIITNAAHKKTKYSLLTKP